MNDPDVIKLPRLLVDQELSASVLVFFDDGQAHYLRNVLRRKEGDVVRVFNGRNGEWLVTLKTLGKKSAEGTAGRQLHAQPKPAPAMHLFFAPIKKARMDWLVEKAVELGATRLCPVITRNTEARRINSERMNQQIREAAEQCERLEVPGLDEPVALDEALAGLGDLPLLACLERERDATPLGRAVEKISGPLGFLIGPEGGFTAEENAMIKNREGVTAVSLGETVLRCETAAAMALAAVKINRHLT